MTAKNQQLFSATINIPAHRALPSLCPYVVAVTGAMHMSNISDKIFTLVIGHIYLFANFKITFESLYLLSVPDGPIPLSTLMPSNTSNIYSTSPPDCALQMQDEDYEILNPPQQDSATHPILSPFIPLIPLWLLVSFL